MFCTGACPSIFFPYSPIVSLEVYVITHGDTKGNENVAASSKIPAYNSTSASSSLPNRFKETCISSHESQDFQNNIVNNENYVGDRQFDAECNKQDNRLKTHEFDVVKELINRVESEYVRAQSLQFSTLHKEKDEIVPVLQNDPNILRVRVPSPEQPPLQVAQPSVYSTNFVASGKGQENKKLNGNLRPIEVPSPVLRDNVASKQQRFIENERAKDIQGQNSSRKTLDIPEGVVPRSKSALQTYSSSEKASTSGSENGSFRSDGGIDKNRKSVHEIKAGFEPRPESSNSSVKLSEFSPTNLDNNNVNNADFRKRRSVPPSANFQERATVVNSVLEGLIKPENHISATVNNNSNVTKQFQQQRELSKSQQKLNQYPPQTVHKITTPESDVSPNTGLVPKIYFGGFNDEKRNVSQSMNSLLNGKNSHQQPPKNLANGNNGRQSDGFVPVGNFLPPSANQISANGSIVKKAPPPEPPIDYNDSPKKNPNKIISNGVPVNGRHVVDGGNVQNVENKVAVEQNVSPVIDSKTAASKISDSSPNDKAFGGRKSHARRTVTRKTRVYVVDGVQMTSTTYHIMADDGSRYKAKEDYNLRKIELQALRRLQKEETRQFQELTAKTDALREQQERKFAQEMQVLINQYDSDLEIMIRYQKKQLEEAERVQDEDLRIASRKLKQDQEKDFKTFRESLRQEHKILKQEIEMMPARSDRREIYRRRKEILDIEQTERERQFKDRLMQTYDSTIKRLQESHRQKIAHLERQFLQQKHQLLRAREAAVWEVEERQLHDKHQLAKTQLKDIFFLQRSQMLLRHQKELEHVKKLNNNKEEELIRNQTAERKRLPKMLKSDAKTRTMMFRESLKIRNTDSAEISRQIRDFEERETKRLHQEIKKQELKHKKRLDHLRMENEAALKELEQLQNEKRKMLLEHETLKLKQYDEDYSSEMKSWRSQLKPRKQTLEDKFAQELREQEQFYQISTSSSQSSGHMSSVLLSAGANGV